MAKSRSPRYPMWSLPEAVQRVRKIFEAEPHNEMSAEAMVRHMGYTALSGTAGKALSALRKYGLVEGRGEALHVSRDALTILTDEGSEDQSERAEALRRAAMADSLFSDLANRYSHIPSETTLVSYLTREGFKPDAALTAARNYITTMEYVEGAESRYNVPKKPMQDQGSKTPMPAPSQNAQAIQLPLAAGKWATLSASFPLSENLWTQMMNVLNAMKPALVSSSNQIQVMPDGDAPIDSSERDGGDIEG